MHSRYLLRLVLLLLIAESSFAQIKLTQLDRQALPRIQYTGKIVDAVSWNDTDGTHYLLTTETGEIPVKTEAGGKTAALYAYHYLVSGDSLKQTWKVTDPVYNCVRKFCRKKPDYNRS